MSCQWDLKTPYKYSNDEWTIYLTIVQNFVQEKIAEIHSAIYEEIHPRINQALAGLDEALSSQQMDMDEGTH